MTRMSTGPSSMAGGTSTAVPRAAVRARGATLARAVAMEAPRVAAPESRAPAARVAAPEPRAPAARVAAPESRAPAARVAVQESRAPAARAAAAEPGEL